MAKEEKVAKRETEIPLLAQDSKYPSRQASAEASCSSAPFQCTESVPRETAFQPWARGAKP